MTNKVAYIATAAGITLAVASFSLSWWLTPQFNAKFEQQPEASITPSEFTYETREGSIELDAPAKVKNKIDLPISTEDLPRYLLNARPSKDVPEEYGKIIIVIDDVGVVERGAKASLTLPPEVVLAVLPYGKYTMDTAFKARVRGMEVMIHLPMQPKTPNNGKAADPGPNALFTHYSIDQIRDLARTNIIPLADLSVGVNNHMGSKFTEYQEGLEEVLKVVQEERLFFMDSVTTANSAVSKAAEGMSLPMLRRNVFLDHEQTEEFVEDALAKLENLARKNGHAIGIGHPHQITIDTINKWASTLEEKKLVLVPITNILTQ